MNVNFPKGTSSILIKKHGLANWQAQAIYKHMEYAQQHYKDNEFIYAWWVPNSSKFCCQALTHDSFCSGSTN